MQFNKKMNKSGGITVPAALRRELGIEHGEKFSVSAKPNGSIELRRIQGHCVFCRSDENLVTHQGRFVCDICIDQLYGKKGVCEDATTISE